jgi:hypothetical protein
MTTTSMPGDFTASSTVVKTGHTGVPVSSSNLAALPGDRLTSAAIRVPGISASARTWNRAIIPQPTMANPSMSEPPGVRRL